MVLASAHRRDTIPINSGIKAINTSSHDMNVVDENI